VEQDGRVPADHFAHQPLGPDPDRCRPIIAPGPKGWDQVAMGEWRLTAGGFGDCHPHDEVTYVLEGLLEVDCDGVRVTAGPGDVVRVPAGHPAYYHAPEHAGMLYNYGPNPQGLPAWTFQDRDRVAPPG
jgi:hypothetical protein